jgi:Beta-propeller repeat
MSRAPKALFAVLGLSASGVTLVVTGAAADQPGATATATQPVSLSPAVPSPRQIPGYGNLPISFEANVGQAPSEIEYLARGNGYLVALTEQAAILGLRPVAAPQSSAKATDPARAAIASPPPARVRLRLLHAQPRPRLRAERQQTSVSNYFVGNDPTKWHSNIANYAAVRYEQIYPGIDWVVYGNPQQLEYDFVVAPRSEPRQIALRIDGAQSLKLDDNGDLLVKVRDVTLRQLKPVIYQTADDGARHDIDGHYVLTRRQVSFALGPYDHSRQLIIDPTFVYSTYLGGSGRDAATGIAVDGEGNAYVAGATTSTDFPTAVPLQASNHSASAGFPGNAFIFKFNTAGSALIYSTYLGGSGNDTANAIAVDSAGNAYVTGSTTSTNFPTAAPFQAANHAVAPTNYPSNAFVAKLNASGSALVYSTYLGGSGPTGSSVQYDTAYAIAVDGAGNAYVAGATASPDFPTLNPFQAKYNGGSIIGSNAFVAKLDASGSALVYSTYLGGSFSDGANGIAVDSAGSAYVVGSTGSTDFPTLNPFQATNNASTPVNELTHPSTAFLTKFSAAGSTLVYSTYLGGTGNEGASGIAVDSGGNAYITGSTSSTDFPTVNPLQATNHSTSTANPYTAFVTKFNAAGSALTYSTYLGGSINDQATAIAVDSAGNAYVAGFTYSSDFPTVNALQTTNNGAIHNTNNAFVSILDNYGNALEFSTYLGGSGTSQAVPCPNTVPTCSVYGGDGATAIGVDGRGDVYVTGSTYSTDFPTAMAFQGTNKGNGTAFVTKIEPTLPVATQPPPRSGGGAIGWGLVSALGLATAARLRKRCAPLNCPNIDPR